MQLSTFPVSLILMDPLRKSSLEGQKFLSLYFDLLSLISPDSSSILSIPGFEWSGAARIQGPQLQSVCHW